MTNRWQYIQRGLYQFIWQHPTCKTRKTTHSNNETSHHILIYQCDMPVQLEPTRMHETLGGKSEARNVYFNFPIIVITLNYLAWRTINHRSKFQWLTCITSTGQETRPILSMFCKFHIKKLSGQQNSGRNYSARSCCSKHLFHLWWQRLDFVYDLINKVGDHHIVKPPLYWVNLKLTESYTGSNLEGHTPTSLHAYLRTY